MADTADKKQTRGKQGFASMDPERVRQIASRGGNAVPSEKRPFARDRTLAIEAGRKGGQKSHSRQVTAA